MTDISQIEFHQGWFKDTVDFKFNKNNVDLYRIRYFISGKLYWKLAWLDTGNITIKAHTSNTDLVTDTVINSPAYYDAIAYLKFTPKRQGTLYFITITNSTGFEKTWKTLVL